MMEDDRSDFEKNRREKILSLGRDEDAFQLGIETFVAADRHQFTYLWSWMGLPIIQMPTDIVSVQEIVWQTKPDVIIESGVARGGSVVFLASLLQLLGRGKVIGVDIDIRAHNRENIESHPMSHRICLIEGPSLDPKTIRQVEAQIPDGAKVMVILDSDHSFEHVLGELQQYSRFVTVGQYIVAADTILGHLSREQTPVVRSKVWYQGDEPLAAVRDFLERHPEFEADPLVNGKQLLASSPGGYLVRKK
jgi:cephalosporin hydroxylase